MKTSESSTKICPIMTNISPDGWNPAYCVGETCACWETTVRKREEMELNINDFINWRGDETVPKALKDAGWAFYGGNDARLFSGKRKSAYELVVKLVRYTDILEGECGLTHPREG